MWIGWEEASEKGDVHNQLAFRGILNLKAINSPFMYSCSFGVRKVGVFDRERIGGVWVWREGDESDDDNSVVFLSLSLAFASSLL